MTTYTIEKETITLTITVNGTNVTVINHIKSGKFAGKSIINTKRYGSKAHAAAKALHHAQLNGWVAQ